MAAILFQQKKVKVAEVPVVHFAATVRLWRRLEVVEVLEVLGQSLAIVSACIGGLCTGTRTTAGSREPQGLRTERPWLLVVEVIPACLPDNNSACNRQRHMLANMGLGSGEFYLFQLHLSRWFGVGLPGRRPLPQPAWPVPRGPRARSLDGMNFRSGFSTWNPH